MMARVLIGLSVTPPGAHELSIAMAIMLSALCCLCVACLVGALIRRSRSDGSNAKIQSAVRASAAGIIFSAAAIALLLVT